jgi:hypothetical protein
VCHTFGSPSYTNNKHNWKPKDYVAFKIAITTLSEKEIKDKLNTKKCKAIKKNL